MRYITFSMHGRSKNRLNYWRTECCCWKKSELLWVREWEWKGSMYAFIESVANDGSFSTHWNPLLHQNQLSVNTKIEKNTHTHTKTDQTPSTKHVHCEMCNGTRSKVCAVTRCDSKSTKNPCDRYCLSDCSSVWHAIYIPLMYNAILKCWLILWLFFSFRSPGLHLFCFPNSML